MGDFGAAAYVSLPFRLSRDRPTLYTFQDTPGRLAEIAKLRLEDVSLTNGGLPVVGKGRKEWKMPGSFTGRRVRGRVGEGDVKFDVVPPTTPEWIPCDA